MPIVNGKYESPIWENNQPPAMDAAEMQAITDSVEESIHALGDYTTPAQKMGLTGDLSVGASLGVLADIGNVHVWRKTVKTDEKIPATYSLGPEEGKAALTYPQTPSTQASFHYGKTITVDDNGTITINGEQTLSLNSDDSSVQKGNNLKGNFFYCDPSSTIGGENEFETGPGNVYFIPSDATISREPDTYLGGVIYTSKYQEVRAVPAVPPGTHVTYLTSVNRNAYQEGDDAKEAGYALGRIVKVTLGMSNTNDGTGVDWRYSDSVVVNSDGVVSLGGNPTQLILASWDTPDVCDVLKGKFACPVTTGSRFSTNEVVFFPNDTVFSKSSVSGGHVAINAEQYQIVTGYPAIPAGTTIEYLGVLGEKSKIQVLSYVGTGTSGEANPCSVTASFPIKALFFLGYIGEFGMDPSYLGVGNGYWGDGDVGIMFSKCLTTAFTNHIGFDANGKTSFGKKSADGKTFYWYNKTSAVTNDSGSLYYFLALG